MPTIGGIVVPTGGAAADGRRTLLDVMGELARPVDASDDTILAMAGDAFRSAVQWMNRKGMWPWEILDEDISQTANVNFSTATGVIKKPLAMHYLDEAGGTRNQRIEYQPYDIFAEKYTLKLSSEPYIYTIPNLFETAQIRWFPTPSAAENLRFTYYRATPAPKAEQEAIEIPEYVIDVYMTRAWYEFLKRLPERQRPSDIGHAKDDARRAFREISAHVAAPGDRSRHMDATGGAN